LPQVPDQRKSLYRWRDKFLEAGSRALASRNGSSPEVSMKARISELERIIGKQAVKIEILKKITE
jgi:transposase